MALSAAVFITVAIVTGLNWSWFAAAVITPLLFVILTCWAMLGMMLDMFIEPHTDNQVNAN